jgi:hypothetical protein
MAPGRIGQYKRVAIRLVAKEVIDPLLLHQSASKGEVCLAVLHTVVSAWISPFELEHDVEPRKHFFENLGHTLLLKNPALRFLAQQPDLGDDLHTVRSERDVACSFTYFFADPAEVPFLTVKQREVHGHFLPEKLCERYIRGILGKQIKLEIEEL